MYLLSLPVLHMERLIYSLSWSRFKSHTVGKAGKAADVFLFFSLFVYCLYHSALLDSVHFPLTNTHRRLPPDLLESVSVRFWQENNPTELHYPFQTAQPCTFTVTPSLTWNIDTILHQQQMLNMTCLHFPNKSHLAAMQIMVVLSQ